MGRQIIPTCPNCGSWNTTSEKLPDGSVPYWTVLCAECGASIYADREIRAYVIGLALIAALAIAGWRAVFAPEAEAQTTIYGVVSVIDGDTIEIHGQRIRLDGSDTPEEGKRCGSVSVHQRASLHRGRR